MTSGKSSEEFASTLGAGLGAVFSVATGLDKFTIWHSLIGFLLILILIPYWRNSNRPVTIQTVYAAVIGFCVLLVLGPWVSSIFPLGPWINSIFPLGNHTPDDTLWGLDIKDAQLFSTWIIFSVLIFFVRWPFREKNKT